MRNNQDRLGAQPGGETPPVSQPTQQTEQPLQFVTPTEFVELPSKGAFYPQGHPLHNVDTIEIRHMTAKDEDILTSRALLQKGIAIDRFLQNVIVDQKVKVADLLVGDKNAIIIASRITGYGAKYEATVGCPSCQRNVAFSFDLEQCEAIPYDIFKELGVQKTQNNTFLIHLDKLDMDVEVRLLTSKDEAYLLQLSEKRRKNKLPEANLTEQLRRIIVSVNGQTDSAYINSFIEHAPAIDSRKLRTTYQKMVPNIDMRQNFVCPECAHEGEVSVPFGANFFWPQ